MLKNEDKTSKLVALRCLALRFTVVLLFIVLIPVMAFALNGFVGLLGTNFWQNFNQAFVYLTVAFIAQGVLVLAGAKLIRLAKTR